MKIFKTYNSLTRFWLKKTDKKKYLQYKRILWKKACIRDGTTERFRPRKPEGWTYQLRIETKNGVPRD